MAFPQTVIPVHVRLYLGANPSADPGTWPEPTEITSDVRVDQGIQFSDGRQNEAAEVDASDCQFSVDNRAGKYTPTNPNSPYYGRLRRNTPMRISTDLVTDTFTRTTAGGWGSTAAGAGILAAGLAWSHLSPSDYSTNGTSGLMQLNTAGSYGISYLVGADAINTTGSMTISTPVVATGASIIAGFITHYKDGSNRHMVQLVFGLSGAVSVRVLRLIDGVQFVQGTLNLPTAYTAGQAWKLRWDVNGPQLLAKAWPAATTEPASWQCSVVDGSIPLGTRNGVFAIRSTGNTNGAQTITFDDYTIESIDYSGYITELPTRWDLSGRDSVVPMRAAGILRRLQQGSTPLKSAMVRQLTGVFDTRVKPTSFWPLEDDASASVAANLVPGGAAMDAFDIGFANGASDLPAVLQVARLNSAASRLRGVVRKRNGSLGWSAMILAKLPAGVATSTLMSIGSTGNLTINVLVNSTQLTYQTFNNNGVLIDSYPGTNWSIDPTKWFALQFEVDIVGGVDSVVTLIWHQIGSTTYYSTAPGAITPSLVSPYATSLTISSSATLAGTLVSSAWVGDNTLPFVDNTFSLVSNAYIGENAGDRFSRLLREEGITGAAESGATALMGPQQVDAVLPLLRACAQADYGVVFESGYGLALRPLARRYSRDVVLTANAAVSGQISDPPEPTYDDQNLRNYWVVSREGGAQGVTVYDETSIAAEGKYDDAVTLNVLDDSNLVNHAGWRVLLGTLSDMRWPLVSFDLARNAATLIQQWRAVAQTYGQRINITGTPSQVGGQTLDLIVEGRSTTITPYGWDVSANCSPGAPWNIPVLDATEARMDTAGCYLAGSLSTTGALVPVITTLGPAWSTSGADLPYDIVIAGERMTVTAATTGALGGLEAADGTMESGSSGWVGTNGVVTNTAVLARTGTKSSLLTVTGTPASANARTVTALPTYPGASYIVSIWVRTPVAASIGLAVEFFDAAAGTLGVQVGTQAVTANTWTNLGYIYTAPALAATMKYGPTITTPASGTLIYFDDVTITTNPAAGLAQLLTVTRSVNGIVKTQAGGPATAVSLFAPTYLAL